MQYKLSHREPKEILLDEGWTIMTYGGEIISIYTYSDGGHAYHLPIGNLALDRHSAELTDNIAEVYYEFDTERVAHIWLRDIRFRGGEADFATLVKDAEKVERKVRSLRDAFNEEFDYAV